VSQTSFNSKNTELNADNQKTPTESRSESEVSYRQLCCIIDTNFNPFIAAINFET